MTRIDGHGLAYVQGKLFVERLGGVKMANKDIDATVSVGVQGGVVAVTQIF